MRKLYVLFILLFLVYSSAFAQPGWNLKENSIWPCIMDSALDFNSGSPVKIKSGIPVYWCTGETDMVSFASVCDRSGHLLFYTDGDSIWNRNNQVMPDGFITTSTGGSSQGLLIAPVLNNPDQYYLFSFNGPYFYVLSYSIIDMTLNHGLGDVVPGKKNIGLDSGLTDAVIATPGNNCDIWLISHDASDSLFKSYHITTAGIDTAVVLSRIGSLSGFYSFLFTNFAVSPNRQKLAFAGWGLSGEGVELFDFDANTGTVSNKLLLDSTAALSRFPYGTCFSPDNTKLYFSQADSSTFGSTGSAPYKGHIYQFDLSLPTPAAIVSSETQLPEMYYYFWGAMISPPLRLGPDGKIYLPADAAYPPPELPDDTIPYLGCINYPNLAGSACNFQCHAIEVYSPPSSALSPSCAAGSPLYLPGSELVPYALGADYVKPLLGDTTYTRADTSVCLPLHDSIVLKGPSGYFEYLWNDGNTDSVRKVWSAGTYYVHAQTYCHIRVDTFGIKEINANFFLGNDTVFCHTPFPYKLSIPMPGASYLWQDSSTDSFYIITRSGLYSLTVTNGNCKASDSIKVTYINTKQHLGGDTAICNNQPIQLVLKANIPPGGIALWDDGSFDSTLFVHDTGSYWVMVTDGPCQSSDTINVSTQLCDCAFNMPSAFSPNGDGKNDLFRPIIQPGCKITGYLLQIYNRWGQMVWMSYSPSEGWDGTFNGIHQEVGAYQYVIQFNGGSKGVKYSRKGDITLVQ